MRPVNKLNPSDVVVLPDGTQSIISDTYTDYTDAKAILVANLDCSCSYCENAYNLERDLQVEHIQPKGLSRYTPLKTKWSNFLLACPTCNGMDNKGEKDVKLEEVHLPHRNNTYLSLVYREGGVVEVNPVLTGEAYKHAENLWKLVGLNKTPETSSSKDKRWEKRGIDWKLANRFLAKYRANKADVETIIELVKGRGGWSIWFTVFEGVDEVRKALINDFRGTAAECFDANNHYAPRPRNEGQADPV